MDPVLLSRIQFGVTTAFHIIFPTLTIGLAIFLVVVEFLWLRRRDEMYYRMYRFWVKIFAIHFAVGVVTGITLEFEFGTNWAIFSQKVANVMAPMLGFEVMTAFFLEAGFLGIMLFGWKRVPPAVHFLSTCLVGLGASFSAFWIMAANAWMQTPAGYEIVDGVFYLTSFREAIFNPAFPTHLAHMLLASYEASAFAVAGISAYFLLKGRHIDFFKRSMALGLIMAAVVAPLQVIVGDLKGQSVAEHQPAKLAAIEAHWETNVEGGAAFSLFGFPDQENERNRLEIRIPYLLSLIVTHSLDGRIQGLKDFPKDERPNVLVVFWSFHLMVAIGFLYFGVMIWAGVLWKRKRLYENRPFLKTLVAIQPLGFIAVWLGWITAEMGRQPWIVYGLMRTSDGVSPIAAGNVVWSLAMFAIFFTVIGTAYFYYTLRTLDKGPDFDSPVPHVQFGGTATAEKLAERRD
jgi:cytochrome bd ubiquinol oxidase subunit I